MHTRFVLALCLFICINRQSQTANIEVSYRYDANSDKYEFEAKNLTSSYLTIVVVFERLVNLSSNAGNPAMKVVPPGVHRMLNLEKSGSGDPDFNYRTYYWFGTANPKIEDISYVLPVDAGKTVEVRHIRHISELISQEDNPEHFALGFNLLDGDTIRAVRKGVIEQLEQENQTDTLKYAYTKSRNKIHIRHDDGTIAVYSSFKNHSAMVGIGDEVFPGSPLAIATQTSPSSDAFLILSVNYLVLMPTSMENYKEWGSNKSFIPKFMVEGYEGELQTNQKYTAILNEELVSQEMTKRQKKKYLAKEK